jgi:hypothetical protein
MKFFLTTTAIFFGLAFLNVNANAQGPGGPVPVCMEPDMKSCLELIGGTNTYCSSFDCEWVSEPGTPDGYSCGGRSIHDPIHAREAQPTFIQKLKTATGAGNVFHQNGATYFCSFKTRCLCTKYSEFEPADLGCHGDSPRPGDDFFADPQTDLVPTGPACVGAPGLSP